MEQFACTTFDQFLTEYGPAIGQKAEQALAPLHVPGRDPVDHEPILRKPFEAQAHVVTAGVKVLNRQKTLMLIGEMGTGKTLMAQAICHTLGVRHSEGYYRALVMCPGQLVKKWARELEATLPGVIVHQVESFADLAAIDTTVPPAGATWYIVGRDRAKLTSGWKPAYIRRSLHLDDRKNRKLYRLPAYAKRVDEGRPWKGDKRDDGQCLCPGCGQPILDKDGELVSEEWLTKNRRHCTNRVLKVVQGEEKGVVCGERLWQDCPKPRRFSPARYVKAKHDRVWDFFVIDEAHEAKSADSIQAQAVADIAGAAKRVVALTGTLIGGYAEHVFYLLFRVGLHRSLVAEGIDWQCPQEFNERYGRIETRITESSGGDDDDDEGKGQRYGRGKAKKTVTKYVRPGIVPTLFGKHLADSCIFLSLDEVAANLPVYKEDTVACSMNPEQQAAYDRVSDALMEVVKEMVKNGNKKVLGTMLAVLLAYPDYPFDWGVVGYWDFDENSISKRKIWVPIIQPPNLDPEKVYPKEQALVDQVRAEIREGRQVWVYTVFTDKRDCAGRLERIFAKEGFRVAVMRSSVPPAEREDWIEAHGKAQVIISHPDLVKTGLDFFNNRRGGHNYCSIFFYQTGYNTFTLLQAAARAWRIGQQKECRTFYFFYSASMQSRAMVLMGQKVAASNAISGRFSSEGLTAMAGENDTMEMAMARALVEKTGDADGEAVRAWSRLTTPLATRGFREVSKDELAQLEAMLAEVGDEQLELF